jgi:hypothetical protein
MITIENFRLFQFYMSKVYFSSEIVKVIHRIDAIRHIDMTLSFRIASYYFVMFSSCYLGHIELSAVPTHCVIFFFLFLPTSESIYISCKKI